MIWIVLTGVPPWNGRHEFDETRDYTTQEWGWIKRHSGFMPLTINEGLDGGDAELSITLAVIALHRNGRIEAREVPRVFETIAAAEFGSTLTLEPDTQPDEEDADAGPPASRSSSSTPTSGAATPTSSETPDGSPNGTPDSGSSVSHQTGSVT